MGLPLTTKALSKEDYEPLIDKIRTRMLSWTNKSLSYAGRLQLLNSVISSITHYGFPGFNIIFCIIFHSGMFGKTTGSWIWRKLLKLCPLAYQFIRVEVGNGEKAFFWHDDWLRIRKLIELTGATGTRYLGIVRSARVCDAVAQGQWRVRGQRRRHFQDLHAKIQAEPVPNQCMGEDRFLWRHETEVYKDSYSASRTWEQLRRKKEEVNWSSSVWFKQGVPRFAFIVLLAIQNRLSTGDRMRQWRIQQGCVLCGERDKTRDHLFFACPYSYTVWDRVVGKLMGRRINPDWSDMLRYIRNGAANLKNQVLISLLFQVVVYHIWRERNLRRNQQGQKGTELMISTINKTVKNRISSLGYEADHRLEGLLRRWFEVFD
ncbi:uncharacterized protein LOC125590353 [Brassica napus]|uniref:uncharacterized protein LOC125590353 n=1 Tax=Brassica napus TaxID=3708 RepID=UPI0020795787|nr:uncharacterized protein LOC125590353 [Brassica napus]